VRWLAIVLAGAAFLAVSVGLTFLLRPGSDERAAVAALIRAQARGDVAAMLAALPGCSARPACLDEVGHNAAALRHPGAVEVLQFTPSSRLTVGEGTGLARIAWRVGSAATVVQCVRVRHGGGPLGGRSTTLLSLSAPIDPSSGCR